MKRLRSRLFLYFSIMTVIPLFIATAFSYSRYTQTISQRIDEISTTMFDNAVISANELIDQVESTIHLFSFYYSDGTTVIDNLSDFSNPDRKPEIISYYNSSLSYKRLCTNILYSNEYIYGIYVLTPSGYIFSCSNDINGSIDQRIVHTEEKWFKDASKSDRNIYISTIDTHSLFTGTRPSVFFAHPMIDVYTHKSLGMLVIDCDPEIFDLSTANTMPNLTMFSLENKDTMAVLFSNIDDLDDFAPKNPKVFHQDLALSPLRLTAVIDYDSLFADMNITGMLMLAFAAFCFAAAIPGCYILSRNVTKPLEHLSTKMASQRGHSLALSTHYLDRPDEIGTLYNEYNAMVDSLNAAVKQDFRDKLVILDAQMKSLEARINSHFLFNTLEAINSMAEIEENEDIATMSLALGNMFRFTLKTQSELVTVTEELNHVRDYVSIQQIRFDNRFRLDVNMTEEFKQYKVLKLILQPLVENALYHGLNYCTTGDLITITGTEDDHNLYLEVLDNGIGMDEDQLKDLQATLNQEASFTELGQRTKQSIGLKNIHSRIELYYGRGYGLTVTSKKGEWTKIQIKLPKLQQEV